MGSLATEMSQRFARAQRVRRRAEFERVYETGVRARGHFLTVIARPNGLGLTRLGVAATRKLGGVVCRNRAKRLVRAIFRRNRGAAGFDVVVIPRPELLNAEFASLEADYRTALRRALAH
jgi:ribonuclease P protein component